MPDVSSKPSAQRPHPVGALAWQLRHSTTGVQARLRRAHPLDDARGALFETEMLLHAARIDAEGPERVRWALVLHCLALARGLQGAEEPGLVLARIGVSPARLKQLVESDFATLADLLPRVARRIAAANAMLDWRPLADLLLCSGTPREDIADHARRRIVRFYLSADGAGGEDDGPAPDAADPAAD